MNFSRLHDKYQSQKQKLLLPSFSSLSTMEVWCTLMHYSNIIYNQEALFFPKNNNDTTFSIEEVILMDDTNILFCFLIGDAKKWTSRQRSSIHPLVHCWNVPSGQGCPRSREPNHLSHFLLAPRVYIIRNLEAGTGTRNQTKKLQYET